jgi:hypothetical protein
MPILQFAVLGFDFISLLGGLLEELTLLEDKLVCMFYGLTGHRIGLAFGSFLLTVFS